jgi:hypothetical protein
MTDLISHLLGSPSSAGGWCVALVLLWSRVRAGVQALDAGRLAPRMGDSTLGGKSGKGLNFGGRGGTFGPGFQTATCGTVGLVPTLQSEPASLKEIVNT